MNCELCIGSAFAQDQYARRAPVGRGLAHIDTVATHFLLPLNGEGSGRMSQGLVLVNQILEEAFSHLGARYRSGGKGPRAFDCSGFTSYVFNRYHYQIGSSSRDQYARNIPVRNDDMRRGDLVFFTSHRSGSNVGHVGIVVDVDPVTKTFSFIHASTTGGVRIDRSTDGYYARRFIGVRRVF